jgi:hypothetical protein
MLFYYGNQIIIIHKYYTLEIYKSSLFSHFAPSVILHIIFNSSHYETEALA